MFFSSPLKLSALMLTLTACGSDSGPGSNSNNNPATTNPGPSAPAGNVLLRSQPIAAGEQCAAAGIRVDTGLDSNANGQLDDDEVSSSQFICNGVNGTDGKDGVNGTDGKDGVNGTDGEDGKTPQLPKINNAQTTENSSHMVFTLTFPEPVSEVTTVTWGTVDVTAKAGEDYRASAGQLAFAIGEQSKQVQVELINDDTYECSEYFMLQANSTIGNSAGFGRIDHDGDRGPELSVSQTHISVNENAGKAVVNVELAAPSCVDNQVNIAYSQVSTLALYAEHAEAGSDFDAVSSFTINAGETSASVELPVMDDNDKELRESLKLTLSSEGQLSMGENSAQIDILPVTAKLFGGFYSNCVLSQDGLVKCWGYGDDYNFATGETKEYSIDYGEVRKADLKESCDQGSSKGLIVIDTIANDNSTCSAGFGGISYRLGPDSNANGELEEDEQTKTGKFCNTSTKTYLYRQETLTPNKFVCEQGGSGLYVGTDANNDGILQISDMGANLPPAQLGDGKVVDLGLGEYHGCALFADGTVKCWGNNRYTGLGIDYSSNAHTGNIAAELGNAMPNVDFGDGRSASQLTVGENHSCVILDNGRVKCWGSNSGGSLGYGDSTARSQSVAELDYVDLGTDGSDQPYTATYISAGDDSTCAILNNGGVKCWGKNSSYQLGYNDNQNRGDGQDEMGNSLPFVNLGGVTATSVLIGYSTACAQLADNTSRCWGSNGDGQVGLGWPDRLVNEVGYVSSGSYCGTEAAKNITQTVETQECDLGGFWLEYGLDANDNGVLDDSERSSRSRYCNTEGHTAKALITPLAAGNGGDCDQFGGNSYKLGYDHGLGFPVSAFAQQQNVLRFNNDASVSNIAMSYYSTCVVLSDGNSHCWGDGGDGALGSESNNDWGDDSSELASNAPAPDMGNGRTIKQFAGRGYQNCALLDNDDVKCWGYSEYGELGRTEFYDETLGDDVGEMGDNLPAVEIY